MQVLRAAIVVAALSCVACAEKWMSFEGDPLLDPDLYEVVSRDDNTELRGVVDRHLAGERQSMSEAAAADWDCRDFVYREHLRNSGQYLVRCRANFFLVVADGEVTAAYMWAD